jgi:6-pyruvoyl-tetrahydropterin synthase
MCVFDPKSEFFLDYETAKPLINHYKSKLDLEHLITEFQASSEIFGSINWDENVQPIASKSKLKTKPASNDINDKFISTNVYILKFHELAAKLKDQIPNLFNLLTITLTIPITSVECERSFSCMRRIKDYKRNRCGDERLSNLMTISTDKDIAKSIDFDELVKQFRSKKTRRLF